MKRSLFSIFCLVVLNSAMAQRSIDLKMTLPLIEEEAWIDISQPYVNILMNIKNLSNETFLDSDSLAWYVIMNTDTINFSGQNNYTIKTNVDMAPGETRNIPYLFFFDTSFFMGPVSDIHFCIYVKPLNRFNPITDPDLNNNIDCKILHIVPMIAGNTDALALNRIKLYPNPASNQFSVEGENLKSVEIKDQSGKTVLFDQEDFSALNCKDLSNGIYFVNVKTENHELIQKLVIRK